MKTRVTNTLPHARVLPAYDLRVDAGDCVVLDEHPQAVRQRLAGQTGLAIEALEGVVDGLFENARSAIEETMSAVVPDLVDTMLEPRPAPSDLLPATPEDGPPEPAPPAPVDPEPAETPAEKSGKGKGKKSTRPEGKGPGTE